MLVTHTTLMEISCRGSFLKKIILKKKKSADPQKYELEFRESDVLPGQTEVKQGKFVEFISRAKGYFRDTYKSQNINTISPTPKFTLGIMQIKVICPAGWGVCR